MNPSHYPYSSADQTIINTVLKNEFQRQYSLTAMSTTMTCLEEETFNLVFMSSLDLFDFELAEKELLHQLELKWKGTAFFASPTIAGNT